MMMNDDDDDNDPIFFFLFLSFLARPDGPFDFGRIESDGQNWVKNLFFSFSLLINLKENIYRTLGRIRASNLFSFVDWSMFLLHVAKKKKISGN